MLYIVYSITFISSISSFNKTSKQCTKAWKSYRETDKIYPRFVEEKIEQIKSRLITFGGVDSAF